MSRIEKVLEGDVRSAARLMRDLDDRLPGAIEELKALHPHTGKGYIIGITGNPGAGKSTLVDALITLYRQARLRVGVVAVDPTSPFSGGAILGDRIRMQRHASDEGVFIRSLATRGQLGGLSRSTFDVASVLDAMGYERIIIETVGVGQDEIEVMKTAYTSVVVTVPGLGDDIQAIKAGILEIADVLVVNKADRDGADRAVRDLFQMLDLRGVVGRQDVEIVKAIATQGTRPESGVADVVRAIDEHRERMGAHEIQRKTERAMAHIGELVRGLLADRANAALRAQGGLEGLAASVVKREQDPYSAAESVLKSL
ncbi:MAG: methylmalonyl Co-A mutase-associated GTPase MeaB [Myxococcales bacterium]|nr:methylmalonyl Co-A mutase-associated GTPase MeaB [Myxococcales bacterium]